MKYYKRVIGEDKTFRARMREQGITIQTLAERMGFKSRGRLCRILAEKEVPSEEIYERMVAALRFKPECTCETNPEVCPYRFSKHER